MLTAQRLVERALRQHADRVAIVDGGSRLTYRELRDRSGRLANALLELGAGPERPAAALLRNRAEYVEFDVACTRAGIARLGISDRLAADECAYLLEHSRSAVLVTTPDHADRLGLVPDGVRAVLSLDGLAPDLGAARLLAYEEALAASAPALDVAAVPPSSPSYILYTSGTTGRPKGATHTHGGRVAATLNMLASELRLGPDSVMLHAGPLTHGSGAKVIALLAVGGANVVLPRFDPEEFARVVRDEGGTHTFLVPTMIQRLLDAGPEVARSVSALEQISFGGSPIAPTVFRRAIETFGPILTQVYGSSEAPHPVTVLRPSDYADDPCDRLLRSAGRPAYGVDIRVVGDDGAEVEPAAAGELLVRGGGVMAGYWRDAAATAETFRDGWYLSGDLVTVDDDQLVAFEDRKRDLIITGGLNVYPSEIERVLAEHPAVREVAVVGYPDDEWGESVMAYVVPSARDAVSQDELIGWVRDRLASYKKPRRVEFLDAMPLGSSNKILKRDLRDALWQGRDRRVG